MFSSFLTSVTYKDNNNGLRITGIHYMQLIIRLNTRLKTLRLYLFKVKVKLLMIKLMYKSIY